MSIESRPIFFFVDPVEKPIVLVDISDRSVSDLEHVSEARDVTSSAAADNANEPDRANFSDHVPEISDRSNAESIPERHESCAEHNIDFRRDAEVEHEALAAASARYVEATKKIPEAAAPVPHQKPAVDSTLTDTMERSDSVDHDCSSAKKEPTLPQNKQNLFEQWTRQGANRFKNEGDRWFRLAKTLERAERASGKLSTKHRNQANAALCDAQYLRLISRAHFSEHHANSFHRLNQQCRIPAAILQGMGNSLHGQAGDVVTIWLQSFGGAAAEIWMNEGFPQDRLDTLQNRFDRFKRLVAEPTVSTAEFVGWKTSYEGALRTLKEVAPAVARRLPCFEVVYTYYLVTSAGNKDGLKGALVEAGGIGAATAMSLVLLPAGAIPVGIGSALASMLTKKGLSSLMDSLSSTERSELMDLISKTKGQAANTDFLVSPTKMVLSQQEVEFFEKILPKKPKSASRPAQQIDLISTGTGGFLSQQDIDFLKKISPPKPPRGANSAKANSANLGVGNSASSPKTPEPKKPSVPALPQLQPAAATAPIRTQAQEELFAKIARLEAQIQNLKNSVSKPANPASRPAVTPSPPAAPATASAAAQAPTTSQEQSHSEMNRREAEILALNAKVEAEASQIKRQSPAWTNPTPLPSSLPATQRVPLSQHQIRTENERFETMLKDLEMRSELSRINRESQRGINPIPSLSNPATAQNAPLTAHQIKTKLERFEVLQARIEMQDRQLNHQQSKAESKPLEAMTRQELRAEVSRAGRESHLELIRMRKEELQAELADINNPIPRRTNPGSRPSIPMSAQAGAAGQQQSPKLEELEKQVRMLDARMRAQVDKLIENPALFTQDDPGIVERIMDKRDAFIKQADEAQAKAEKFAEASEKHMRQAKIARKETEQLRKEALQKDVTSAESLSKGQAANQKKAQELQHTRQAQELNTHKQHQTVINVTSRAAGAAANAAAQQIDGFGSSVEQGIGGAIVNAFANRKKYENDPKAQEKLAEDLIWNPLKGALESGLKTVGVETAHAGLKAAVPNSFAAIIPGANRILPGWSLIQAYNKDGIGGVVKEGGTMAASAGGAAVATKMGARALLSGAAGGVAGLAASWAIGSLINRSKKFTARHELNESMWQFARNVQNRWDVDENEMKEVLKKLASCEKGNHLYEDTVNYLKFVVFRAAIYRLWGQFYTTSYLDLEEIEDLEVKTAELKRLTSSCNGCAVRSQYHYRHGDKTQELFEIIRRAKADFSGRINLFTQEWAKFRTTIQQNERMTAELQQRQPLIDMIQHIERGRLARTDQAKRLEYLDFVKNEMNELKKHYEHAVTPEVFDISRENMKTLELSIANMRRDVERAVPSICRPAFQLEDPNKVEDCRCDKCDPKDYDPSDGPGNWFD